MENLVEITTQKFDVILDLRYASDNNVCGHQMYSYSFCYLHKSAIDPFKKAIESAKEYGLKLKIWDTYRPIEVQKYMFDKFPSDDPTGGFVSNPENGAIPHCRGIAIDLTLVDENGKELEMGTDFDEFSELASHDCTEVSKEAQKNRKLLFKIMCDAGFDFYSKEWWHYQLHKPREFEIAKADPTMISI